jgi:hypothetical protein
MYTFLLLLRRVHIRECVPLWCDDFDEIRSDSGITGFAVAPAPRVGVSQALYIYTLDFIYLSVYRLVSVAVSNSDCIASNDSLE